MKFDIACDKWSVITDKSDYEISKSSPCCCWLEPWAILPQFRTSSSFAGKHFFFKSCMWVTCNNKWTNEMQNICNFQIFSKSPLLYPKFVQIFQIGPKKHNINFQGLASFWNYDCFWNIFFFKTFSIKFCTWKSNRFFSLHWASPLKMPQSQNRGYESEKMTLKLE